ncbi:MAG: hypothetical protein JW395_3840 [Nitrospira sp.]|nr:hypothetical protein [Nitrospira sp.]
MPKEPPVLIRDLARKFCFGIYEMPSSVPPYGPAVKTE